MVGIKVEVMKGMRKKYENGCVTDQR